MEKLSVEDTTYQYPDPNDLDDRTRLAWAGDDNDYIPEALRQTLSSNWPASEAGFNDHVNPSPYLIRRQENEGPENQGNEVAAEADQDLVHFDDR